MSASRCPYDDPDCNCTAPVTAGASIQESACNISSEQERVYYFADYKVQLADPVRLYVAESGSHRVVTLDGWVTYIPTGWSAIAWLPYPDAPEVVL